MGNTSGSPVMLDAPVAGPTSGNRASASTPSRISASTLAVPTTVSSATGLSTLAMSRTLRTVCSTFCSSSRATRRTVSPWMPPFRLSQSKYSRAPAFSACPVTACEPDSGNDWMTLMSAWATDAASPAQSANATAASRRSRVPRRLRV